MATRNPTRWMWAEACELLEQAERMHRQFFLLTKSDHARPSWEPPVDVFEDDDEIIVVVAMVGVADDRIEVSVDAHTLIVRAESRIPFGGPQCRVQRLEIPYGHFERRIALPAVQLEAATRRLVNGCLIINLRKRA